jgi:hypothetical protein
MNAKSKLAKWPLLFSLIFFGPTLEYAYSSNFFDEILKQNHGQIPFPFIKLAESTGTHPESGSQVDDPSFGK